MQALDQTVVYLARHLTEVKPALDPAQIGMDCSLTADLGLDSLDLVELANRLTSDQGVTDLTPWLAQAMGPGGDTVRSLAAFLLDAGPPGPDSDGSAPPKEAQP
ncbi:MAG TPA: hypothetical protein VFB84_21615 [Micromonosporaceae bacterium]|nr:hypothetical protein [Micromonosporaceae bacterium]